jgi:GlpG protein
MPDSWDYSQPPSRQAQRAAQTPLLTYFLVGLCVLVTLAFHTSQQMPGTLWFRIGRFGVLPSEAIWEGNYLALFTCVFVHGDILHLLFNTLWLLQLGRILELTLSPMEYALFFLTATIAGSGAELAVSGQTGIGASGVVYGMFGLLWAGRGHSPLWRAVATRDNLRLFILWGVFCVFATWAGFMHIANAAHGAGFLFGLSVGWAFYAPRRRPLWAIPLAALAALTLLSVTWMPWSGDWNFWKGGQAFDRQQYAQAIRWYERSLRWGMEPGPTWENISRAWHNIAVEARERKDWKTMQQAEAQSALAKTKADAALSAEATLEQAPAEKSEPGLLDSLKSANKPGATK